MSVANPTQTHVINLLGHDITITLKATNYEWDWGDGTPHTIGLVWFCGPGVLRVVGCYWWCCAHWRAYWLGESQSSALWGCSSL